MPVGLIAIMSVISQPLADSTFIVFYPEEANSVNLENLENLENLVEGTNPYKLISPETIIDCPLVSLLIYIVINPLYGLVEFPAMS